jgi:transcription factor IIIB subunit 2
VEAGCADSSSIRQINVYVLAAIYLKLTKLLLLELPLNDPSLYLNRFAAKLEFGGMTNRVANTALRLIQRFNRDWLDTGRRPSGICGACELDS